MGPLICARSALGATDRPIVGEPANPRPAHLGVCCRRTRAERGGFRMDPRLAFARQFGNPKGVLGAIAGRAMAKGNAAFNTWLVGSLAEEVPPAGVGRLLELGH